jgi:hypothetical protein
MEFFDKMLSVYDNDIKEKAMSRYLKKIIGCWVVVVVLVALTIGCAHVEVSSAKALVGVWKGTSTPDGQDQGMQVEFEMKEDGTFTETIEVPKVTFSGRYSVDSVSSILMITVDSTSDAAIVPVGASFEQDITISRDGRTFRATGGGSSGEFKKQ